MRGRPVQKNTDPERDPGYEAFMPEEAAPSGKRTKAEIMAEKKTKKAAGLAATAAKTAAAKAKATKDTKAEEKPLTGEPVSPAKAKEINDLVKEPESKKAEKKTEAPNPDAQIDKGELPELRKKMRAYTDKNADGKENIKKWLAEHGAARVSEILNKDLPSFLEVLKDA